MDSREKQIAELLEKLVAKYSNLDKALDNLVHLLQEALDDKALPVFEIEAKPIQIGAVSGNDQGIYMPFEVPPAEAILKMKFVAVLPDELIEAVEKYRHG